MCRCLSGCCGELKRVDVVQQSLKFAVKLHRYFVKSGITVGGWEYPCEMSKGRVRTVVNNTQSFLDRHLYRFIQKELVTTFRGRSMKHQSV